MIVLKNSKELALMKQAGKITAEALWAGVRACKPGTTTWEINRVVHETITSRGATPSFLGLYGFPAAACISVNEELIHGIPDKKHLIKEGDIVSIDVVQTYAESYGYGVVREYVGHGVGRKMHEDPEVPNYGHPGRGVRLMPGMTIAIEPMINLKGEGVYTLDNDWTVVTESGSPCAHFEHTIAITDNGPVILTKL